MKFLGSFLRSWIARRTAVIVAVFVAFSLVWISSTDRLLGWVVQDPRVMTTLATYKGMVYIAVCALLLAWMISGALGAVRDLEQELPAPTRTGLGTLLGLFGLAALAVVLTAVGAFQLQRRDLEGKAFGELASLAESQRDRVDLWLGERLKDAQVTALDPLLSAARPGLVGGDAKVRTRLEDRLRALKAGYEYASVSLLDPTGRVLASTDLLPPSRGEREALPGTLATTAPRLVWSLEGSSAESRMLMSSLAPCREKGQAWGVLVFRMRMEAFLDSLPGEKQGYENGTETLLGFAQESDVILLGKFGMSRYPEAGGGAGVGGQAIHAREAELRGADRYGVPVLAVSRRLESLPWILYVKMDQARATGPLVRLAWIYSAFSTLILALLGALLYAWWSRESLRNRAHQARLQQEKDLLGERLLSLSRYANDIVLLLGEDGRILDANDRALAAYGYTREQMLCLRVQDLRTLDQSVAFSRQFETVKQEGSLRFETTHVRKDGTFFPVEVSARGFEQGGRFFVQSIARDISDRKEAEARLGQSRERFRRLFEEAVEGLVVLEAEGWLLSDCNLAFQRLVGRDREALLGRPFAAILPEAGPLLERLEAALAAGIPEVTEEMRLQTPEGQERVVRIRTSAITLEGRPHVHGIFVDLTEARRREWERETTVQILGLLAHPTGYEKELIGLVARYLQEQTGCQAVGVRLKEGEDFPYYETRGFPEDFVRLESRLCARDAEGRTLRDPQGNPVLECMCGNILCGRFNPELPFFTPGGSFWTNSTTELLASTSEEDRQARTRNRCHGEGYESVALIPLRAGGEILGLLQLNDPAKGKFSPELIHFLEQLGDQIALALAQRRAEEELRRSEQRFRIVADHTHDWEYWASPEGAYIYNSPSCERVTGYTREELQDTQALLAIVLPEDQARFLSHSEGSHRRNTGEEISFRILRKDGQVRWLSHVCQPILEQGTYLGSRASNRDVTDQVQAREWLRESEERLRRTLEAAQVGTWEWNIPLDEGLLSARSAEIIGFTLEELGPAPLVRWRSHGHPGDMELSRELVQRHLAGELPFYDQECRMRHRDGRWIWIHTRGKVTEWSPDGQPLRMSGTHLDITARKEAEEALREQEAFSQSLLEQLPGIFYLYSYPELKLELWNRQHETLLGYGPGELRGVPITHWHPPERREALLEVVHGVMKTGPASLEMGLLAKDGTEIPFLLTGAPFEARGRTYLMGIGLDITEQKRAEAALRESEGRFQKLFDALQEGLAVHEILTDEAGTPVDYRYLDVNPAFEAMTGLPREQWLGHTLSEILPGAESFWAETYGRVALTGESTHFEHFSRELSRWYRIHAFSPAPRQFAVLCFDITEKKAAEKAVQDQLAFLNTLLDTIPVPIFTKGLDGRYATSNHAFAALMGQAKEALRGKTVREVADPTRSALFESRDRELLEATGTQVYQTRMRVADGSLRDVVIHKATYRDAEGRVAGLVGILIDVTDRYQAEEALRHSEAQLRALVESAPDPIFIQVGGVFAYVNPALVSLLGASSPADILGHPVLERNHPSEREATRGRIRALNERHEKQPPREVHFLRLDGESIYLEISAVPFRFEEQDGALVFARDVTERRRAAREIASKTELLNLTGQMAKVGGWEFDAHTLQGSWTDEVARIHDLDPQDPTSVARGITFYPEEDRRRLEAAIQAAIENATPYDLELAFVSAKGIPKIVHTLGLPVLGPDGTVVRVRGIFQDVTVQRQAEAAAREEQAKLEAALTSMQDAVFISDAEGRFIHLNDAFATFHRFKDKAECMQSLAEYPDLFSVYFLDGTPAPMDQWAVSRALRGEVRTNEEYLVERKDTGERWVGSYNFGPIRDRSGAIVGSVVAGRDITERKAAENQIRRLNDELEARVQERTAQLEAANQELESFSYSVSHDLRAPLRGIDGFSRALVEDCGDRLDDQGRHYLDRVRQGAQRMGQLIDDLLRLSRVSRAELLLDSVNLSVLAQHILEDLSHADPSRRVELRIQPGLRAHGDSRLLKIALENLLANAWKFTQRTPEARIEFGLEEGPAYFVRDNGAGFDMTYQDKLFKAFQRLHSVQDFEGTGIGLAIVQRVIHRHGGRVWAEGEPDRGATFHFQLPPRGEP